jgi:hypothetical protein
MSCRSFRSPLPSITIRVSEDEKDWFATLARSRGLSESALALSVIRSVKDSGKLDPYATGPRTPATDRITIRLRPGDGEAIGRRALERGMKPSAYLAALARAHLAVNPPLAAKELAALKQSIVLLAGLGTHASRGSRAGTAHARPGADRAHQLGEPQCLDDRCICRPQLRHFCISSAAGGPAPTGQVASAPPRSSRSDAL